MTSLPSDDAGFEEASAVRARLTLEEKRFLMGLARSCVKAAVRRTPPPVVRRSDLTRVLELPADTFVTLYKAGNLRGCIGSRTGSEPIYRSVMESAAASATRDPRFPPVSSAELRDLSIHISILTPPRHLNVQKPEDVYKLLKPNVHGVTIRRGPLRALYLPQVWEHFAGEDDIVAAFLSSLSRKAGDLSGTIWKQAGTEYEVFEADSFGEDELADGA